MTRFSPLQLPVWLLYIDDFKSYFTWFIHFKHPPPFFNFLFVKKKIKKPFLSRSNAGSVNHDKHKHHVSLLRENISRSRSSTLQSIFFLPLRFNSFFLSVENILLLVAMDGRWSPTLKFNVAFLFSPIMKYLFLVLFYYYYSFFSFLYWLKFFLVLHPKALSLLHPPTFPHTQKNSFWGSCSYNVETDIHASSPNLPNVGVHASHQEILGNAEPDSLALGRVWASGEVCVVRGPDFQ